MALKLSALAISQLFICVDIRLFETRFYNAFQLAADL
jgi:hypothetical protein